MYGYAEQLSLNFKFFLIDVIAQPTLTEVRGPLRTLFLNQYNSYGIDFVSFYFCYTYFIIVVFVDFKKISNDLRVENCLLVFDTDCVSINAAAQADVLLPFTTAGQSDCVLNNIAGPVVS